MWISGKLSNSGGCRITRTHTDIALPVMGKRDASTLCLASCSVPVLQTPLPIFPCILPVHRHVNIIPPRRVVSVPPLLSIFVNAFLVATFISHRSTARVDSGPLNLSMNNLLLQIYNKFKIEQPHREVVAQSTISELLCSRFLPEPRPVALTPSPSNESLVQQTINYGLFERLPYKTRRRILRFWRSQLAH